MDQLGFRRASSSSRGIGALGADGRAFVGRPRAARAEGRTRRVTCSSFVPRVNATPEAWSVRGASPRSRARRARTRARREMPFSRCRCFETRFPRRREKDSHSSRALISATRTGEEARHDRVERRHPDRGPVRGPRVRGVRHTRRVRAPRVLLPDESRRAADRRRRHARRLEGVLRASGERQTHRARVERREQPRLDASRRGDAGPGDADAGDTKEGYYIGREVGPSSDEH